MYLLTLTPKAEEDLARLDVTIEQRILSRLKWLCENCDGRNHKALKGRHKGKSSFKVTKHYRALYAFDRRTGTLQGLLSRCLSPKETP